MNDATKKALLALKTAMVEEGTAPGTLANSIYEDISLGCYDAVVDHPSTEDLDFQDQMDISRIAASGIMHHIFNLDM